VLLNDGYKWTVGTYEIGLDTLKNGAIVKKDIQSVVTHELGHALGLAHTGDSASSSCVTMHTGSQCEAAPCSTDTKNLGLRSLETDDTAGLKEIYGPTVDGYYVRGALGSDKPVATPVPQRVRLLTAYPNPFNPEVAIAFVLEEPAVVSLSVYDVLGQKVSDLVAAGHRAAGQYTVPWRPGSEHRASGVYLVRLASPDWTLCRKIVLAR
jgi:hypothetical protein